MMKTRTFNALSSLLSCTLFAGILFQQAAYGQGLASISGRVSDPTGAVIPAAAIMVTETRTGFTRSAASSQDGYYTIPSLRPSEYKLVVNATGFRHYEQDHLILTADQAATVNIGMEVGTTSEVVNVEANVLQVDLQTATLKQVVEEKRINELPLDGRNAATLALLVGGVMDSPADGATQCCDKTVPGAVSYTSNGSRQNQINFKLDGAENMDGYTNVNQPFPFPDVLQEFSVQTSNYGAELGSQSGGAVNIVTKSGSNEFHGNAFEYVRNKVFNARNFFAPVRDELKRNQFGGTIGGPIIRNRTFFFFGFQSSETRNVQSAGSSIVPTAENMRGDFSALLDANSPANSLGRSVQITDRNGMAFPGNIIPASRLDPAALRSLKGVPEAGNVGGFGRVFFARPIRNDNKSFFIRGDQSLSANDRLSGRYFVDDYDEASTYNGVSLVTLNPEAVLRSHNALVHETHTFRPNLINDFRASYGRVYSDRRRPDIQGETCSDWGIRDPFLAETGQTCGVQAVGYFQISNTSRLMIVRNFYQINDDVKWIKGRHNISIGGMVQLSRVDLALPHSIPFMRFTNDYTGYAVASYLLGVPQLFTQSVTQSRQNEGWFPSFYIQDDFRATSRLSLSLGLRYDPYITWGTPSGQISLFSVTDALAGKKSTQFVNAPPGLFFPGDDSFPKNGAEPDLNNFAPRFGFAYDLFGDGKTSLRGGAGMFYDQRPPAIFFNAFQGVFPWSITLTKMPPANGTFSDPLRDEALPIFEIPPTRNAPWNGATTGATLQAGRKSVSPITYNWNLTIERQIAGSALMRLSYVGTRANYLGVPVDINAAIYYPAGHPLNGRPLEQRRVWPTLGNIRYTAQEVNAHYHGFQAGLEKRLARGGGSWLDGITLLANYTYSKSMDDFPHGADPTGNTGGSDVAALPYFDPNRRDFDYGPSRFDRKHRFVASYLWDLPALRAQPWMLRHIIGGWQATGIFQVQSGLSFTILAGVDRSLTGIQQDRVQYIGGDPYSPAGGCRPGEAPCVNFLNPAAFTLPAIGSAGNVGKGSLRGPNFWTWDMGFLKNINLTERIRFQFRAELFNIFNHTNFIPSPGQNDFNYSNAGFGGIRSAGSPRIGQLALKFFF
jgi:hypothetical protein